MSDVEQYGLGAKPDRYDPRDYRFTALVEPLIAEAAAVDRRFYTMVERDFRINQGREGTCVGHGATNVILAGPSTHPGYADFQTEERAHEFARRLYLEASGDATYQTGMYPRDACAKLLEWELIESYWRISLPEGITTALLAYGPVMVAVPWYESMFSGDNRLADAYGNYWIKVNMESEHVGYHCIALTGVDLVPDNGAPPFFRVENSWGSGWGQNGTARITVENFRRLNLADNWTFAEKAF